MTHSFKTAAVLSIGLLAIGGSAFAQQPPDVVQSDGYNNTAMGTNALIHNEYGSAGNTAAGAYALSFNTTGYANTASGSYALYHNTGGIGNAAFGESALQNNIYGTWNVAVGTDALFENTGSNNTATGYLALYGLGNGNDNTAVGTAAMMGAIGESEGSDNTAIGTFALTSFTSASYNAAVGQNSLYSTTTGSSNAAFGYGAMTHNISGNSNVAVGVDALKNSTAGSNNIAVGNAAGSSLESSNNIDIGHIGEGSDAGVIRIGTPATQTATYIAGIENSKVTGSAVYITSKGQLGVLASSERYKTAIQPIGSNTEKLRQLRPVSFHLKTDPDGAVQYGLIAEEVAKVYPELVTRDDTGKIQGVRYDELAPMLLNEVQKQAAEISDLKKLVVEMQAGVLKLQAKDELIARH
jgi:hypothetical protein